MVTIDEFSRLVSGFYRSAVNPGEWIGALDELRRTVGATGGGISMVDGATRHLTSVNVPEEALASYGEYYQYLDYVLDDVEGGPVGLVRGGAELVGLKSNTEFDADWMRPYGMNDGLFVRVTDGAGPTCLILAAPSGPTRFDSRERVQLVNAVLSHLQLSLRTQRHVEELVDERDELLPAVDVVHHGIIIVGPDCVVVHMNSAAERILRARDGLRVRSGVVEGSHAAVHAELRRSIQRAFTCDGVDTWGGSLCCPRPSGLRPYVIHVLPAGGMGDASPRCRRVIVVVVDPETTPEPSGVLLRRLYGLTTAEADVAVRLATGAELQQISGDLSVSIATVRKHLQHLYAKTDTHRQAELVRLLLAVLP